MGDRLRTAAIAHNATMESAARMIDKLEEEVYRLTAENRILRERCEVLEGGPVEGAVS